METNTDTTDTGNTDSTTGFNTGSSGGSGTSTTGSSGTGSSGGTGSSTGSSGTVSSGGTGSSGTGSSGTRTSFLNRATTLNLHTGNLVNRSRLKKKCPSSPSEELQDCIRATLSDWYAGTPSAGEKESDVLDCSTPQTAEAAITPEEREELKVSVKLFLCESDQSSIREAVDLACLTLALSQLDSVILAPPPGPPGGDHDSPHAPQTLSDLRPAWVVLETLVASGKVVAIGTSDLDKGLLEELHDWAQVKPTSNQVNLASCCVMPPDLTAYAKQAGVQLLTHNDPKELITAAGFQEALRESAALACDQDNHDGNHGNHDGNHGDRRLDAASAWRLRWVLRYSIIVKSRGIIKAKGYLVHATRVA